MLKVDTLVLGTYQTNCYIIREESSKTCCVIDPGYFPEVILRKLEDLGLTLEAVLLTHGHFDHVGAVRELAAETDCDVYICEGDLSMPPVFTAGPLYYTHTYGEGSQLSLAGLSIRVLETPGHTPGSVCLMTEDAIFSGDTLFEGDCGRTDLPGGNWLQMQNSLKRLGLLEGDYRVYPGHDVSTTLAHERKYNTSLKGAL